MQAVAAANKNTIVVVHSVGPIILETILATPGVRAVVWAGLPSQENGNALVDILYGLTAPSGKLVYTIAKKPEDYGTSVSRGDDSYKEGLFVDYRHFDNAKIEPRFEFGFGLCKSTPFFTLPLPVTPDPNPISTSLHKLHLHCPRGHHHRHRGPSNRQHHPRRPRRPLGDGRDRHGGGHQLGRRRRRRGRPAVPHAAVVGALGPAQAATRLCQAQVAAWCWCHGDLQLAAEGS